MVRNYPGYFTGGLVVETSPCSAGDTGSIPGQGGKIPHASGPKSQNIRQKHYLNKFNKDFKSGPHQKEKKRKKSAREGLPGFASCLYHLILLWYWARHDFFMPQFAPLCSCLVTQSCPALCNPMDCSPPDSSVHGVLQARILKWVAISSSRGSSPPKDRTQIFCISCIAGIFFTTELPGKPCTFVKWDSNSFEG